MKRPAHPDFERIAAVITEIDRLVETDTAGPDTLIAEIVDLETLAYVAIQRAMRILGITTIDELSNRLTEATTLAAMYHEGFIVGYRFQR